MSGFSIKQGVTFQLCCIFKNSSGAAVSLVGCTVASQIRDPLSQLLATLSCVQPVGQQGVVNLYFSGSTRNWAAGRYFCDVLLTGADGVIRASQTFPVTVMPSITAPGSLPPDGVYNRLDVEVVDAGTVLGDGSGLDVTSGGKALTLAEWIAALSLNSSQGTGAQGVGIKSINVTQGSSVAGQPSTVTLTATLTDGTTTAPATFEAPAGSAGAAGAAGATGGTGPKGDPGDPGQAGATGPQGVGIASVAVSQGAVTPGQSSTVTLTATMTNGATAPGISFETPPGSPGAVGAKGDTGQTGPAGVPGSDADVTTANIKTALGYTPADGSKYLPLNPAAAASLPAIVAPADSNFGSTYSLALTDPNSNSIYLGCIAVSGVNWFGVYSPAGHSTGLRLADFLGNSAGIAGHSGGDGTTDVYTTWFGLDASYYEGGIRWINKDGTGKYWKISATELSSSSGWLALTAGSGDAKSWQSSPLVSFDPDNNRAQFTNEPVTTTAYTFATLPPSPVAWQRAVVTDKAIGSGAQGVMAMWNPNTKAWTGLGGEALT
ncbi:hypothetical protein AD945_01195 [Gluconobacter albidus]|uniref:Uncharacterized protein n=1 Tax=Gluconobacter albidus TaxID=318683 RepID=A0A149TNE3_9PROT|nr:hypothetical protein [Gluconobacter albidus]KXV50822.1 hypothetical protein AD945_01195 [Gluconobacter albidus]